MFIYLPSLLALLLEALLFLLDRFSHWLIELGQKYPLGKNIDDLHSYAEMFAKVI